MPLFSSFTWPRRLPLEAVVWTAALGVLACTDPHAEPLWDLCLFKAVGLPWCAGCGLGHAVAFTFRGAWEAAFAAHPLGPFAVVLLTARIVTLLRDAFFPSSSAFFNHG